MTFSFHPGAQREVDDAIRYYERCRPGLGYEFADEVYAAIHRVMRYPEAWGELSPNTRRCLVTRFPYGVVYQAKPGTIRIIAVAHLSRRPGYWRERV